jgi:hypothetical protein
MPGLRSVAPLPGSGPKRLSAGRSAARPPIPATDQRIPGADACTAHIGALSGQVQQAGISKRPARSIPPCLDTSDLFWYRTFILASAKGGCCEIIRSGATHTQRSRPRIGVTHHGSVSRTTDRCHAPRIGVTHHESALTAMTSPHDPAMWLSPKRFSGARALVDVAMGDGDRQLLAISVAGGEMLGDGHRAVATAGAADRDDEVGLPLGHVLG